MKKNTRKNTKKNLEKKPLNDGDQILSDESFSTDIAAAGADLSANFVK